MIWEAPAKVNLTLEVTGIDERGYHRLDTLFAWLHLCDELELTPADEASLVVSTDGIDLSDVTSDETNLALRALRAMEREVGRSLPTRMKLLKRIPVGGGLGGGSADAAAALIGLNELYKLGVRDSELVRVAQSLGADVAFGLRGRAARGRGLGDELEHLEGFADLEEHEVLLLVPTFPCSTPEVYQAWDESPSHEACGCTEGFLNGEAHKRWGFIKNDLQPAAERLYPALRSLAQDMVGSGLKGVVLCGSGSTLMGFLPPNLEAQVVERALRSRGRLLWTRLRKEGRRELKLS